jgi:ribosomal protein S18 acetylase RimI-like enzyme
MGEIVIRRATTSDLTECAQLISNDESGVFEDWRSRFEQDLADPQRLFLVATVDDSVAGYGHTTYTRTSEGDVDTSPTGYFLSGLLISPGHRRQGLGTLLATARIDELRPVTNVIYYRAEPDNRATIDLHARLGFTVVGTVQRDGRDFTLYCLELSAT